MTQAFLVSAEDIMVLRQVVDWFRKSHGEIPQPDPASAFQSPDVYIAKVPDTGIDALSGTTPGNEECDLYRIQDGELSSIGITRKIYNLSTDRIEASYAPVMRTKSGAWIANVSSSGLLVGGCLAEDHPGQGEPFNIHLGTWSSSSNGYGYDTGTTVKAIDWRYGVPYPDAGATGLFVPMVSDAYGTIYDTVSLDCESEGPCGGDTGTGTGG